MRTILVTAIGGDIAQAIIRVLRAEITDVVVIGCDSELQPFYSSFVDEFFQIPRAGDENYLDIIGKIVNAKNIELILPVSEPEIAFFCSLGEIENFPPILMANSQSVQVGLDKLLTYNHIKSLGNYVPRTWNPSETRVSDFPFIMKPRHGRGSKEMEICENFEQLQYLATKNKDYIAQELLLPQDEEITCAIYRFNDGRIEVLQLHRKLIAGRTAWAKVIDNSEISALCRMIAESLNLSGPINVQLIVTDGGPKVFEINPRYSSTVELRHSLGFKDLVWGVSEHFGFTIPNYLPPVTGITAGKYECIKVLEVNI